MCKTKFYCSPLPKTHLPFPALPKGLALWNPKRVNGEGVLSPMFLCKFACGKLVANRRPNYICKTKFYCSPWAETPLNLSRYVLCRPTKLVADGRPNYICRTKLSRPPRRRRCNGMALRKVMVYGCNVLSN